MKILVVTDSHGSFQNLINAFEEEKPQVVLCAGDHSTDAEDLSYVKEEADYYIVRGNCDYYDSKHEDILKIEVEGKKILLAHGHHFGVKSTYDLIRQEGFRQEVDMVVFGHTHTPYLEEKEVTLFNPGALKDGFYGVLEIEDERINITLKSLY